MNKNRITHTFKPGDVLFYKKTNNIDQLRIFLLFDDHFYIRKLCIDQHGDRMFSNIYKEKGIPCYSSTDLIAADYITFFNIYNLPENFLTIKRNYFQKMDIFSFENEYFIILSREKQPLFVNIKTGNHFSLPHKKIISNKIRNGLIFDNIEKYKFIANFFEIYNNKREISRILNPHYLFN